MGLRYERDDATRRIVIAVTGPLTVADILGVVDRQVDEGAWNYACIYDRREMTTGPATADVPPIARYVRQLEATFGPRGPVAVVCDHTGSVEMYWRLGKHVGLLFEVFEEIRDAERWLEALGFRTPTSGS
jgi:hypothetical protein